MPTVPSIPTSDLVKIISEYPGLSAYEIAEKLDVNLSDCTRRVHAMCSSRIPLIKKVKVDGLFRFFPFNFKVEVSPLDGKNVVTLSVDGEPLRAGKLTASELEVFNRKKQESKYIELLNMLDDLHVSESVVLNTAKYNPIRDAIRRHFKTSKIFTIQNQKYYLIITRAS